MLDDDRPGGAWRLDLLAEASFQDGVLCEMTDTSGFAERLRLLRKQKNWSQTELAQRVGVHYNHLGRFERGSSRPSADTLKKLADALGVSTDYLIEGDIEDAAKADFADRELLRMFKEVEAFELKDKEIVKALIDAFIKKKRLVQLASDTQPQQTSAS